MLLRIGDKIINRQKIHQAVDAILDMRCQGYSQQEVANRIGVDRTVVSKLETLGEVRKGARVGLIGFPVANCAELESVARQEGVEYCLLLSESQRWAFLETKSGLELFNSIMEIISALRRCDVVIIAGSNMRIKLIEALLDKEVVGVNLGESPLAEDKYIEPEELRSLIRSILANASTAMASGPGNRSQSI